MRAAILLAALSASAAALAGPPPDRAHVPGASFETILPPAPDAKIATVAPFELDRTPVTNSQFAAFVAANPRWRRDRVARVFADTGYLGHWSNATTPARGTGNQPVTQVSWFAAQAYCESEHARLPSWIEWERAAAASATVADARGDAAWRRQLLDWYAKPSNAPLAAVGGAPNLYGVRDLHGLVWEWVDDQASMMVTSDSRDQNDPDPLKFCGSAALSLRDRDNYALLMRIALLSSLKAVDTTANLGFRCARPSDTPVTP
jgi:formylglycine-generating enzyme required for sulfatase activity